MHIGETVPPHAQAGILKQKSGMFSLVFCCWDVGGLLNSTLVGFPFVWDCESYLVVPLGNLCVLLTEFPCLGSWIVVSMRCVFTSSIVGLLFSPRYG